MKALFLFALMAGNSSIALEVRLVVPCSGPHAGRPVKDPDGAGSICLDRSAFLTNADVESAEIHHNSAGHPTVFLTFHHDAAMRELQITLKNIGHHVAILLDGSVISAPKISSGSRLLFIDGNFTEARAQAFVAAFNNRVGR